MQVLNTKYYWH